MRVFSAKGMHNLVTKALLNQALFNKTNKSSLGPELMCALFKNTIKSSRLNRWALLVSVVSFKSL